MEKTSTKSIATWNENTTYALGLYRFITKCLGIWSLICHSLVGKCQILIICILEMTMITSIIGETRLNCTAVNDKIQTISITACCVITVIKVLVIKANNGKKLEIILSTIEDWSSVATFCENERLTKCAQLERFICLFQINISAYTNSLSMSLSGLITPGSSSVINFTGPVLINLPALNTMCFYGELSTGGYISVYMLKIVQLSTTIISNVGTDCYFFGITMHLSGQIEQLIVDMEHFGSKSTNRHHNSLVALIKRQIHLLKLADYLESTFNCIVLLQVSTITYEICLISLQMIVSIREGIIAVVISDLIWLYILHLQLFLYSYAGDRLSTATESLGIAIYKSQWFDLPSEISKDLIFIIMRCREPFTLTARKICNMNLQSFKNIVKAVGSYFSLLLAMFDE